MEAYMRDFPEKPPQALLFLSKKEVERLIEMSVYYCENHDRCVWSRNFKKMLGEIAIF